MAGDAVPAAWNETQVPYSTDLLLVDLVQAQVDRTPDAVALQFEDLELSFGELNRRANQLANRLRSLGIGPDVLVGVLAERSFEMVIALLGVLKAGAAYVPLDPSYPTTRLEFMLADSAAPVLLAQEKLLKRVPENPCTTVLLGPEAGWHSEPDALAELATSVPATTPHHLAYMIYTSGSTGPPKGALNTHRAIVNRLLWMQDRYALTEADAILQKTPFGFDVSGWEFFWPLISGARLVIARPEGHKDPSYLAGLIARHGVTVCHFVPSMLQAFLSAPEVASSCASLRHVICSGETLTRSLQDRFFGLIDAELHNLYGPTEAAIDVTHWTCQRDSDEAVVPIGSPIANTQLHVVDEDGRPVAIGEQGELWIGGVQVARGYLNREELTRDRFVPDPFTADPESRIYRTGDLARWRIDGNLEFLGRMDHQVKILGVRIELGEIESALDSHPGIAQSAVLARDDAPGELRLVAYVAPSGDEVPPIDALRSFLAGILPDTMIPALFVSIDALPLTESGKVDRKALPAPSRDRPPLEQAYVAPRGPLEQAIGKIWSELLHIDGIGVRDRFFDLGGDSLLAAKFIRRMEKDLAENIYIVSIFDAPTISEYARFLERDYAESVERSFGSGGKPSRRRSAASDALIDAAAITRMRTRIPVLDATPPSEPNASPNSSAVFVLAPPRSGTTLLRVMLAGHPELFAAAELQLLGFHTLAERDAAFQGKFRLWREGTIRVLMELRGLDADAAEAAMLDYQAKGFTTKQFYSLLQEWIGHKRLVDKSPSYVLDPAALEKAERDFEDPYYIHLVRHPLAMMQSFERYHMEQVLFVEPHDFSSRQLAELVWLISHENTLHFLEGIPDSRQIRIRYEDLVTDPEVSLRACCSKLGIPFHPDLIDPYKNIDQKMVDGVHAVSAPMGDTRLLTHGKIDPSLAEAWKGARHGALGESTLAIAEKLGYARADIPGEKAPPAKATARARQRAGLGRARQSRSKHREDRGSQGK